MVVPRRCAEAIPISYPLKRERAIACGPGLPNVQLQQLGSHLRDSAPVLALSGRQPLTRSGSRGFGERPSGCEIVLIPLIDPQI